MRKIKLTNRLAIKIILIIIILLILVYKLNSIASPILLAQAKEESYNIITKTINSAVNDSIDNLNVDNLFIMSYGTDGDIVSIDFDSVMINKLLTRISLEIEEDISAIDDEVYKIPFGVILKNSFFSNLGPNIPVKLKLVGSIVNNIDTKITNYGINNALIEVYVNIRVNIKVVLPFISDNITVETLIPIAIKLIRGNVPEYYAGSSSNPLLSIPIE